MDFFTLERQVAEVRGRFAAPPEVTRAIDLAPDGYGLVLKAPEGWFCLEIHLHPEHQGIWLTPHWEEAPAETPFGRALQRVVKDARLTRLELFAAPGFPPDRVVALTLTCRDRFFATRRVHHLVAELTGRIANLLLCEESDPGPLAVGGGSWSVEEQLRATGNNRLKAPYHPPIPDGPPPAASPEQAAVILAGPPASWKGRLAMFSPVLVRELAFRTAAAPAADPVGVWTDLLAEARGQGPVFVYRQAGKVLAVVPVKLGHLEGKAEATGFPRVNEAMLWVEEHGFRARRLAAAREQARAHFNRDLQSRLRLRDTLRADLQSYENADRYKRFGDLLLGHLKEVPPGARAVSVTDWETGMPVEIPLDPEKSPSGNAQRFFRLYKKALRGVAEVNRRLAAIEPEIAWISEQLWLCENAASVADLMSLPRRDARKKPGKAAREARDAKDSAKRLRPLLELDGCRFYVGRNGRQNDLLTFSVAKKGDVWCHANDVPGSHVIVKRPGGVPTDADRLVGAILAAWFSFARQGGKVAVDVTDVAHVRRIPGGGPGHVSFTHQKTLVVDPGRAEALLSQANTGS